MYYVKPLMAEDVHYVASIMSETSNITALHLTNHSLAEWKCIFEENARDADEENFLICSANDVCAWLKMNGLQNKDTAWISMLVVADKYKHQGVGKFAVEYAFEYLHCKGFNQIGVQTTEDNNAAKNLYMKCGFSIAGIKKFKAEDGTKTNSYVMMKTLESKKYSLVIPDETHEEAYIQIMDKWEAIEKNIQPELLRRYSKSLGTNVSYSKWLEWCEDDRTTGSMLSTGVPCTLYFFIDDTSEILGAIEINHKNTHRGHLHAGIVPWHRGKGLGTKMLESALEICRNMGMTSVDIVPYKSNKSAIKTILKNGGVLMDEFYEDEKWSQRYTIPYIKRCKMTKTMNVSITNIPSISAIYYALLQSGYDYYSFGRTQEQIETIKSFHNSKLFCNFFSRTKQSTCKTYSYWPRAALLETAVFNMDADLAQFSDFESYKAFVMTASNLQDIERDENFWFWIADFPKELNKVINSESFNRYLIWENTWIEEQNKANTEHLKTFEEIIKTCISHCNAKISNIEIALSPIKCAYSSDYHLVDGQFIFSSGQFSIESVIHEFLHQIVHQHVCKNQNIILVNQKVFDCIDSSYYLSNSENGKLNAFEEYLVKSLTRDFINKTPPEDLDKYIVSLLNEV